MTKVLVLNIAKDKWKSIADTHIDTAYEKCRRYLCQYLISIADKMIAIPVLQIWQPCH